MGSKGMITLGFAVFIAALVVFVVLPRLPDIKSAAHLDFSMGADGVGAECCGDGDGDGDSEPPRPPLMPTGLGAICRTPDNDGFSTAVFSWGASEGATRYRFQLVGTGGYETDLSPFASPHTFYPRANNSYTLGISACNANGCSETATTNVFCPAFAPAPVPPPPPPPALPPSQPSIINLKCVTLDDSGNSTANLAWTMSEGATRYHFRLRGTNGYETNLNVSPYEFYPKVNNSYSVDISACNTNGCSGYSTGTFFCPAFVPAPLPPPPAPSLPPAPSNLSATAQCVATNNADVRLTWSDNSSNETGFRVHRSTTPGFIVGADNDISGALPSNTTSYTDTNPNTSTTYYYKVVAFNNDGFTQSNQASVTTGDCAAPPPPPGTPTCTLTASPSTINPGSSANLLWTTQNATSGSIDNGVGAMVPITSGSKSVSPTTSTTYTATVTGSGGTANCATTVVVQPSTGISCDAFSADPSTVDRGGTTTLRWETSGATSVNINQDVGDVPVDGTKSVVVNSDTTYTLTARNTSGSTATCHTSVTIRGGGGGGGGSSRPQCNFLRASDTSVSAGDRVTLSWKTLRGSKLRIEDDRDNEIFKSSKSDEVKSGEVTVRPVRDTRYTLTVEKGSRDDTCTVRVDVSGQVTVISGRDQQPLTSISLAQVPYTGFDAGTFLTTVFYTLLGLWAASLTYVLVIKKGAVFGFSLRRAGASAAMTAPAIPHAEYQSRVAEAQTYRPVAMTDAHEETPVSPEAALESYAHQQDVVLSHDALCIVMDRAATLEGQKAFLDSVIARAKETYPREDGWVVIDTERLFALFR